MVSRHPEKLKRASTDVDLDFASNSLGAVCCHDVVSSGKADTVITLHPSTCHCERESVAYALTADITNFDSITVWDRHPSVDFTPSLLTDTTEYYFSSVWSSAIQALVASEAWHDGVNFPELDIASTDHGKINACLEEMAKSHVVSAEPRDGARRAGCLLKTELRLCRALSSLSTHGPFWSHALA